MRAHRRAAPSAVLALLSLALTSGCSTSHRPTTTPGEAANPARWRTFHSRLVPFQVHYPASWRAAAFERVSTSTASIVFISDQAMSAPCSTAADGEMSSCGLFAVRHLHPGGTSIDWSDDGGLAAPSLFGATPGTQTAIGGQAAKVEVAAADDGCAAIGGRTSVTGTIERSGNKNNVFVMRACVNADRKSTQVLLVLRSLRSARQP